MSAVLEARAVTVVREGRAIVDGVSLEVPGGAFVSVIGPNGAGKSTLVRALCGLLRVDSGEVLLEGKPLAGHARRYVATRMGYVPQTPPHGIPFSVKEFAEMSRYAQTDRLGKLDAAGRGAVAEALELTGCTGLADRFMYTLSGGEARKAHLASALAQGGDILILDEPTTHLDYRHQREVGQLLQHARKVRGLTVVAVQHDLNQGVLTSDIVLALKNGKTYYSGPPEGILKAGLLDDLFETPFAVLAVDGSTPHVAPRYD